MWSIKAGIEVATVLTASESKGTTATIVVASMPVDEAVDLVTGSVGVVLGAGVLEVVRLGVQILLAPH